MPRTCTVCSHTERSTIDQDLADGESYRAIAHNHGVSKSALLRHQQHQEPRAVTDTVSVTGHVTGQAPTLCPCPCTRIDWRGLAREAQQLCEGTQGGVIPHVAVEVLKVTLALLAKLTESACAPYRAP